MSVIAVEGWGHRPSTRACCRGPHRVPLGGRLTQVLARISDTPSDLRVLEVDLRRDPVFADLTVRAREVFATTFAAITLIDRHRQQISSSSGLPTRDMARNASFCDVTVRRDSHLGGGHAAQKRLRKLSAVIRETPMHGRRIGRHGSRVLRRIPGSEAAARSGRVDLRMTRHRVEESCDAVRLRTTGGR